MRNTIWGVAAAAGLIVVLFVLSRLVPAPATTQQAGPQAAPRPSAQEIAAAASAITPGFVGRQLVGNWQVECAAKTAANTPPQPDAAKVPFTLNADGSSTPAPPPASPNATAKSNAQQTNDLAAKYGRCRTALIVRKRGHEKEIVLIAVFRPIPGSDDVALILRYGPVSKVGGKVILALAKRQAITLPVLGCDKTQCMAFGVLRPNVFGVVASVPGAEVVVPRAADGKRMIIPLSLLGMPDSVAAIRRAG
jgi:hypothetical protein